MKAADPFLAPTVKARAPAHHRPRCAVTISGTDEVIRHTVEWMLTNAFDARMVREDKNGKRYWQLKGKGK